MKTIAFLFVIAATAAGIVHMIDMIRYEWSANGVIPLRDIFWIMAILSMGIIGSIAIFKHLP